MIATYAVYVLKYARDGGKLYYSTIRLVCAAAMHRCSFSLSFTPARVKPRRAAQGSTTGESAAEFAKEF